MAKKKKKMTRRENGELKKVKVKMKSRVKETSKTKVKQ